LHTVRRLNVITINTVTKLRSQRQVLSFFIFIKVGRLPDLPYRQKNTLH
jgi:hypothetical protein